MSKLLSILRTSEAWLAEREVPQPRLDAERLLAHVLGTTRLQLYLMYDRPLSPDELAAIRPLIRRRGQREPIGWILGEVGFHNIDLTVRPGVLVPRPDTEALVEVALEALRATHGDAPDPIFVADVGSGSGAVGLAIAAAEPRVRLYATEIAPEALACTRDNVQRLGLGDRVAVLEGPLLTPIPARRPIDWVVSNPPYIRSHDLPSLQPEVRDFEPRLALDGGASGLRVYEALVPATRARARRGLLVEIGADQGADVTALFARHGLRDPTVHPDLSGHDRVVSGRIPAAAQARA